MTKADYYKCRFCGTTDVGEGSRDYREPPKGWVSTWDEHACKECVELIREILNHKDD